MAWCERCTNSDTLPSYQSRQTQIWVLRMTVPKETLQKQFEILWSKLTEFMSKKVKQIKTITGENTWTKIGFNHLLYKTQQTPFFSILYLWIFHSNGFRLCHKGLLIKSTWDISKMEMTRSCGASLAIMHRLTTIDL